MIGFIVGLYTLVLVVYVILRFLPIPANKWTELVSSLIEPGLSMTRALMKRVLPQLTGKGFDWSPVVLYLLLKVLGYVLSILSKLPLVGWIF